MARLPGLVVVVVCLARLAGGDRLETFRDLFVRMSGVRLSAIVGTHIAEVKLEECARRCVTSTDFDCKSFDFDNSQRVCNLFSVNLQDRDVLSIQDSHIDHYESAYKTQFDPLPKHRLPVDYRRVIPDMTPEGCSRHCVLETVFKCRGFNYHRHDRFCQLLEHTPGTSTGAVFSNDYDYYQRSPQGPLAMFINYGMGRLRPMTDSEVYDKHLMGVHIEQCAETCLNELTFDCRSFDYIFEGERSTCYLSKFIAANTYGLVIDTSNPRHNHYEMVEEYLEYFYATPYAVLPENNLKTLSRVTPNRCARLCLEEVAFICRSFDYKIKDGTCVLSSKTGSDVGGLYTDHGFQYQVHHFEMKAMLDCGGNLTAVRGNFASPGWPRNYAHHENCVWNITADRFKVIKLRLTHLDLTGPHHDPCNPQNDRLIITELGRKPYCIIPNTETLTTHSNVVSVNFVSNAQQDAQGFRLFYSAEWTCNVLLTSPQGEIASPSWPDNYPAGAQCSWRITAPNGYRVRLTFTAFTLELHNLGHCNEKFDHVKILDGGTVSSDKIGLYCGYHTPFTVRSSGRDMFVQFKSDTDPDNSREGFHARYLFESQNGSLFDAGGIDGPYKDLSQPGDPDPNGGEGHENAVGAQGSLGDQDVVSKSSHDSLKRTTWAVITVLLLLLILAVVALVVVWSYYRRKLRRQEEYIRDDNDVIPPEAMPLNAREPPVPRERPRVQPRDRPLSRMGAKPNNIEISGPYPLGTAPIEISPSGGASAPPDINTISNPTYGKYKEENLKNINLDTKQ